MKSKFILFIVAVLPTFCSCFAGEQKRPFDGFMGYAFEEVYPLANITNKTKILDVKVPNIHRYPEFSNCMLHIDPVSKRVVGISAVSDRFMDVEVARALIR